MMQAVDKLHYHSSSMLQAVPASWSEHTAPAAMDFTYDGVYNSFTPNAYNTFPSVLSQTLCELDIDNSIHKLFEGLPEILEDHSTGRDVEAVGRPVVTVASPFFPSTPPAQGSRPSSMCYTGSQPQAIGVTSVTAPLARNNASQQQPVFLRPKPVSQELALVTVDDRKGARARKGKGTGRGRIDAKVPGTHSSGKKVLDAIVPSIQAPPLPSAHVACVVPTILPATAIPAVDLSSAKANEHATPVHPIGLGPQACLRMPKRSRKDAAQTANTRTQKTRYFDKVEHIVRERWRRDDMAGKFLALESLLPPSSKRDRSTIVEDTMKLVKSLQHRKEEAVKRRSELKLAVASGNQSPGVKLNRIIQKIGSLAVIPHGNLQAFESGSPSSSSMVLSSGLKSGTKRPLEAVDPPNDSIQIPKLLSDCVKRFYVQSELSSEDIVIEMICEQIPNFHSILLKSMETFGLEVVRCSVTKTINKLICNITVKPFPFSASVNLSSTSIMEGLSSAFRKV